MGTVIEIYRCYNCRALYSWNTLSKQGCCPKCGSRKITGGSPSNLIEHIKCLIWKFTLKGEVENE